MSPIARVVLALVMAGCGKGSADSGAAPPDVAGRYQAFVTTIVGCDNDISLVQPWAQGPLSISQDGARITLDYGEGAVLDGSIGGGGGRQPAAAGNGSFGGRCVC